MKMKTKIPRDPIHSNEESKKEYKDKNERALTDTSYHRNIKGEFDQIVLI